MIVVTGATGRFGSAVVRTLRSLDLPVRALVRKGSHYYWLNDTGCTYFFGDLRDPQSVRRCLKDATHLIVCTNVRRETKANNHVDVTINGHTALFEAARAEGLERTVLVSCMGVEHTSSPASQARRAAEEALTASGMEYTILRACIHETSFLELAWEIHDKGSIWLPGPGTNRLSILPTRDLARMATASLDLSTVRNKTIQVGGGSEVVFNEALDMACSIVGVERKTSVAPGPLVRLGSHIGKPFRRFANQVAEARVWASEDLTVPPAIMVDTFGFDLTPLGEAMAETNAFLADLRDPERREARMVHPQFYATVYEPGTADLTLLPDGPPPRRD